MNKTAIKNFAVSARTKLMDAVKQKAYELGITEIEIKEPETYEDGFRINNKFFRSYELEQRKKLIQKIEEKDYKQVIEEVSYTWFNRFIAIRFMEVNEYLPTGVRVLSSAQEGKNEPDVIGEVTNIAEDLDLNLDIVYRLQDENKTEDLFKYILIKQCNKLGEIMPMMFETIQDYTELLLPDNLLGEGSVVRNLVSMIDEEDWKEQVEIIGWLYQYYISEKKDEVFADLKKNKKITKETIPAATQLFTPKWIVKYMVENSLGRLWLESHPNEDLQQQWKYYLEEAEQEPDVQEQLDKLKNKELSPEDITVLDPCMGSGHILVYAFDVLYSIYQHAGYSEREIPQLILEKNLYGLDIDDRAAQLAYFALMMKARSYNRRIFRRPLELNVCSIQESNGITQEVIDYFASNFSQRHDVNYLIEIFRNAREYGSIIEVEALEFEELEARIDELKVDSEMKGIFEAHYRDVILEIMPKIIRQAKIMCRKYHAVITNPPYLGRKGMNSNLTAFLNEKYPNSKNDLFAVFIERALNYTSVTNYSAIITQHSWMFLSSYTKLREQLLLNDTLSSMLHLGTRAFEEISGEVVQTTSTIFRKSTFENFIGKYVRLVDYPNTVEKQKAYLKRENIYTNLVQTDFLKVPDNIIAYWLPNVDIFKNKKMGTYLESAGRTKTHNNERFVRYFWEIDKEDKKWVPYANGGGYRKYYGNEYYVVNWSENAINYYNSHGGLSNPRYWDKEGITWTLIATDKTGFRLKRSSFQYSSGSPTIMGTETEVDKNMLGFLNSNVATYLLKILNPTVNTTVNDVLALPYNKEWMNDNVIKLVQTNINIAKKDWDSFEISSGFKLHPFLESKAVNDVKSAFALFNAFTKEQFDTLKQNDEELNRIFIELYGLQEELTPKVDEKDITIRKADKERDIKSFISYAVGCMLGRYSLDQEGLVFAGGEFDESKYKTFKADANNIIPITDDEYFEDDIVSRFIEFVRVTFSEETLEENLDFITEALNKKANETSRQCIRRYFLKDFFKDHVKLYQKRPIYWLFDSGKNDGFKALVYMHRYDVGTVAEVRTDYLHTLQRKYEAEIARRDVILESDASTKDKTRAKKEKEKLQKQLLECQQYDQVIAHIANQKITIDLDDGVKVNYAKFQNVELPQGEGKKPLKANLLAKI